MKHFAKFGGLLWLALLLTPAAGAQSNQLMQGTQIHLALLNGLSTSVARNGDPFAAVVAEPVFFGGQLVLPAGAKIHGQVGNIVRPRHFSLLRGGAAMNLHFRSLEIDGKVVPAQMSILGIYASEGRARKDLHTIEGVVVGEKRDIKADVADIGMGTAGGSVVGTVFSHVARGLAIGLIGGTAYVVEKKGKDVELPAQTGLLVRLDAPVSLPSSVTRSGPYTRDR